MKWFDLSRYGANLYVLPKSDARSRTVLRLEMRHSRDWAAQRIVAQAADPTVEDRFTPKRFYAALADLGFSEMKSSRQPSGTREDFDRHGSEYPTFVAEAVRDSIKLSELQTLMPGLSANDVVDMPIEQILPPSEDFLGHEARWERLRRAMVNDSIAVWVANQNPWAQVKEPVPIVQALSDAGLGLDREDGDKTIPVALAIQANTLGYRDDALVTYYVSEEAAQADGLKEGQYSRGGYAASVPIMVVGEGKVVALRDLWAMPDLRRTISPERALWVRPKADPQSLVVDFLRERMAYKAKLSESLSRLDAWVATPKLLADESPDMVWGAVGIFTEGHSLWERYPNLAVEFLGETQAAFEYSDSGEWRLRKLNAIDNSIYEKLALSAEKVGVGSKEKVLDTLLRARLLWLTMVNADMAAQRDAAMAQAKDAMVSKTVVDEVTDKRKHVDVGEKIGGARKDYAKRSMTHADLLGLNVLEIKLHVNKQNIWPPLDYAAMREGGVEPKVAMAIKLVKDSINTAPVQYSGFNDRECASKYVEVVTAFRNFFSDVVSEDDLQNAVASAKEYASEGHPGRIYGGEIWNQIGIDTSKIFRSNALWLAERKINRATRHWNPQTQQIEYADPWISLIKPSKTATDSEIAERKRKTELDKELHVPHLARVQRFGDDWRDGRDVTADELLERFGFRAIEYGEWLPQKERQEVINMAFDSFADLAQALNLRPKDVSLGGELAVAFGARGTGGRGAALAHFEPGRFVMNMTRLKGAGSLAHEWFHAFDRKMALDGNCGLYASEAKNMNLASLRHLSTRMSWRDATADELVARSIEGASRSKSNAESWLGRLPPEKRAEAVADLGHALESVRADIVRRVESILEENKKSNRSHVAGESGLIGFHLISSYADDVRDEIVSKWRGQLGKDASKAIHGNVWHFSKHESLYQTVQAFVNKGLDLPGGLVAHESLRKQSVFSKDAEQLDKLRASSYWNTTRELFARAGAAYVQDKIQELGGRSDYLVYGADDGRRVCDMSASPNPCGEDRAALSVCFDSLLDEYRAKLAYEPMHETTSTP